MFIADDGELKKIISLFGEDAVRVAEVLESVDEITGIQIAGQTEIRLDTVRKILYRLHDHSLVGLRRSRDKETGWFVFHWIRTLPQAKEAIFDDDNHR